MAIGRQTIKILKKNWLTFPKCSFRSSNLKMAVRQHLESESYKKRRPTQLLKIYIFFAPKELPEKKKELIN